MQTLKGDMVASSCFSPAPSSQALPADGKEFRLSGIGSLEMCIASMLQGKAMPSELSCFEKEAERSGSMSVASTSSGSISAPSTPQSLETEEPAEEQELADAVMIMGPPPGFEDVLRLPPGLGGMAVPMAPPGLEDVVGPPPGLEHVTGSVAVPAAQTKRRPKAKTTLKLEGVPKKLGRDAVLALLDGSGFAGTYDFVYLPIDLRSKCHVGHAVVNFLSEEAAERFAKTFHQISSRSAFPGYKGAQVCEVLPAKVQGRSAHVEKLRKSELLRSILVQKPECLPAYFSERGDLVAFPWESLE